MSNLVPVTNTTRAAATIELAPEAWSLAQKLHGTEFCPRGLRTPAAVLAAMLTGAELGFALMQSLRSIHIIEGRPGLYAEAMRALVLEAGHTITITESNSTRCTVRGQRRGTDTDSVFGWTLDDAKRAALTGKDNWRKYPAAMLRARATGDLCRAIFPDVLAGLSYTVEELEDFDDTWDAPPNETEEPAAPPRRKAKAKARAARRTKPAAAAQPTPRAATPPLPGEDDDQADLDDEHQADDDNIEDAEIVPTPPDEDPLQKARLKLIICAKEADVDHHDIINAITAGRTKSSKDVDGHELSKAIDAAQGLADGSLHIIYEDPRRIEVVETATEPVGETSTGGQIPDDADSWRVFIRTRGVKAVETLRAARDVAAEWDVPAPTNLGELGACDEGLRYDVVTWVELVSRDRASKR